MRLFDPKLTHWSPRAQAAVLVAGFKLVEPEQLEAYKQAQAAKHPGNFWWRVEQKIGPGMLPVLISGWGICLIATAFVLTANGWVDSSIPAFAIFFWLFAMGFLPGQEVVSPAQWSLYNLSSDGKYYSLELGKEVVVPAFVVAAMRRLRELSPRLGFKVEALEQKRYALDPVLYAVDEYGEMCPVLIWNDDQVVNLDKK